ncbi:asparagine synthase C-terminal domain-containing protein, partial [bacterium]|nr:asparagine synthase C-terminal domain-containing protein [bacterium]MBU1881936.1 asparagine synthase C-terminal domain-containing protein [bacterium]
GVKLRTYWQYTFKPFRKKVIEPEAIAEFGQLLFEATRRRISDDDAFAVLLSGGYDSRAILGSASGHNPDRQLNTITWGETLGKADSDAQIARRIAASINSHHTFYRINPAGLSAHFRTFVKRDEGRTDGIGNYPEGLHIFEQIRDDLGVKYLLRGDEVFGWKEDVTDVAEMFHSMSIHDLEGLHRNYQYFNGPVYDRLLSASQTVLTGILDEIPYDDLHDVKDHIYFHQRLINYLNPLSHLKEQIIWMRNPFLDNDLLEYISMLPTEYRLGKKLFIATVIAMFPELNRFPIASSPNLINWTKRFQSDKTLQQFAYKVLFEDANQLDELLNRSRLMNFFQNAIKVPENGSSGNVSTTRIKSRVQNKITRTLGFYSITPCEEIFRLMILKIFADEFLGGSFELE